MAKTVRRFLPSPPMKRDEVAERLGLPTDDEHENPHAFYRAGHWVGGWVDERLFTISLTQEDLLAKAGEFAKDDGES